MTSRHWQNQKVKKYEKPERAIRAYTRTNAHGDALGDAPGVR